MRIILALAVFLTPSFALAEGRNGITVGVGTLGAEISYTRNLNSFFDLVLSYSTLDYDDSFSDSDRNTFDAEASISAPRIGLQFYPLSFLNLEIGYVSGAPEISMAATPSASDEFVIGDNTYDADDIGYLTGKVEFENETAPYLLLGLGRNVGGGLGVNLSLGAIQYGAPKTDLRTEDCNYSLTDLVLSATCLSLRLDVEAEERRVNNDLEDFELWPFIRLGLTYSF